MDNKLIITISSREGYAEDQVSGGLTVGELKDLIEGYDDDYEIVTEDISNQHGAKFGKIL